MTSTSKNLVILHTNDIHGHFDSMPYVAGAVASLRRTYADDHVLYMDLGDHIERMTMETDSSDGAANIEVLNAAGCDLATLGNRELLSISPARWEELADQYAHFLVVLSNLRLADTGEAPVWIKPYVIQNRTIGGVNCRIAFIGLTHYLPKFYEPLGWKIEEPLGAARHWVERLRPEADIVIAMSHLGFRMDKRLAEEVPGIDLIVGAHSHHLLDPPQRMNDTHLLQAGRYGEHVGVAVIGYDQRRKAITAVNASCKTTRDYPADERTLRLIQAIRNEGRTKLGEIVAFLPKPMPMTWNTETPLGNALAAGVRQSTGAEIGMINAGQFVDGLVAGAVSREHLLHACPSPARPCRVVLKGKRIVEALEAALDPEQMDQPIGGFGFSGKFVGTLCLDGAKVEYDSRKPAGERIIAVRVQECPLEMERDYVVGTVDAFACGKGYTALGQSDSISYPFPGLMREVLAASLADAAVLRHSFGRRWQDIAPVQEKASKGGDSK